jgi:hypothetical protein
MRIAASELRRGLKLLSPQRCNQEWVLMKNWLWRNLLGR